MKVVQWYIEKSNGKLEKIPYKICQLIEHGYTMNKKQMSCNGKYTIIYGNPTIRKDIDGTIHILIRDKTNNTQTNFMALDESLHGAYENLIVQQHKLNQKYQNKLWNIKEQQFSLQDTIRKQQKNIEIKQKKAQHFKKLSQQQILLEKEKIETANMYLRKHREEVKQTQLLLFRSSSINQKLFDTPKI